MVYKKSCFEKMIFNFNIKRVKLCFENKISQFYLKLCLCVLCTQYVIITTHNQAFAFRKAKRVTV